VLTDYENISEFKYHMCIFFIKERMTLRKQSNAAETLSREFFNTSKGNSYANIWPTVSKIVLTDFENISKFKYHMCNFLSKERLTLRKQSNAAERFISKERLIMSKEIQKCCSN
jgi:hypothetical protein